jgi:hypothetical protein
MDTQYNKNISPYLFITANSAVGLIKIIPIIFANLSKIDSDKEQTSAFIMTIAALEASSIFTTMTPFFMGKHPALKLAIAIGATTIIVALATYPKEPERPANEEPSTFNHTNMEIINLEPHITKPGTPNNCVFSWIHHKLYKQLLRSSNNPRTFVDESHRHIHNYRVSSLRKGYYKDHPHPENP